MERRATLAGYGELELKVPVERRQFVPTVAAGFGTHMVAGTGQAIAQTPMPVSPSDAPHTTGPDRSAAIHIERVTKAFTTPNGSRYTAIQGVTLDIS